MRIPAVVATLFLLAGCSATDPPESPDTRPGTTSPAASTESLAEFCADLDVVLAVEVAFTAGVSKPVTRGGEPADVPEAQRLAGVVVEQGTTLVPETPEDIKPELSTVVAATQEAVGHLATPDTAGLVAATEVMFRDEVVAARETLSGYAPCR